MARVARGGADGISCGAESGADVGCRGVPGAAENQQLAAPRGLAWACRAGPPRFLPRPSPRRI